MAQENQEVVEVNPLVEMGTLQGVSPAGVVESAIAVANALKDIIRAQGLYVMLNQKPYVMNEGWLTCASMLNHSVLQALDGSGRPIIVYHGDGAVEAAVELLDRRTGITVGRASAICGGEDEPGWMKRKEKTVPRNARLSMAMTRASSKVCRMNFAWIIKLAGFQPTPYEEMKAMEE